MTDDSKHIEGLNELFSKLPVIIAVKDKNSEYLALSKYASLLLFGTEDNFNCIGNTDHDTLGRASDFAEIFVQQDKDVIDDISSKVILDVNSWADNTRRAFLTCKEIYTDPSNKIIGTIFNSTELSPYTYPHLPTLLDHDKKKFFLENQKDGSSYQITNNGFQNLTNREMDCLFYLIRGYSAKMISNVLTISPRTVELHIRNLRLKFNCYNKSQLIEKAVQSGFLLKVPSSFLTSTKSICLS